MKLAEKQPDTKKVAKIKNDKGILWACCPTCGKPAIQLHIYTLCDNLPWKCKNSKCPQKEFEIKYGSKCLI
jgi:hypothetical protein